jgi:hypothetical protein
MECLKKKRQGREHPVRVLGKENLMEALIAEDLTKGFGGTPPQKKSRVKLALSIQPCLPGKEWRQTHRCCD